MKGEGEEQRYILGLKVGALRQARGWSLSELAARSGVSVSYLSEIEAGRKYPKQKKLLELARTLGVAPAELASPQVAAELDAVKALFTSEFVREFPFELFGVSPERVFRLLTEEPGKAGALVRTCLEIGRMYDMRVEQFLFAALRSYQEMHGNHFPELERAARSCRESLGWGGGGVPDAAFLRQVLREHYGVQVDEALLAGHPELGAFRSIHLGGEPPRLLVNGRLLDVQKAFIYAREIGFRRLGVQERPVASSWARIRSFDEVLNNFRASYFAGALLIDAAALEPALDALFARPRWDDAALLALLRRFRATPEMLFYRMAELLPERFGRGTIFLTRFRQESDGGSRLTRTLNLSHAPVPHATGLNEHDCRRWPALQLLDTPAPPGAVTVAAHRVRFLEDDSEALVLSAARPLALANGLRSAVSLGIVATPALGRTIRFATDPAIPRVAVGPGCERCPLAPGECAERAAPPVIRNRLEAQARQQAALERLLTQCSRRQA